MSDDIIVGIDLGTTNSEVAAFVDGRVKVLGPEGGELLPSCVGISPTGELLVGRSAKNQLLLYPDRTVRSVKRKMGTAEALCLAGQSFTPPELSALILRELAEWARRALGRPVGRAVITVPAYFTDAQRSATREGGALAGLEVVRILNEPTAASLAYGQRGAGKRLMMIYDLGGGTFDVSVVVAEDEVTEVLSSHGNNHLGGDDFDELLAQRLFAEVRRRSGVDLTRGHPIARARIYAAAESVKHKLSYEQYATAREENLAEIDGRPIHLEVEISRDEYEAMIRPLVESTLDSVSRALEDAGRRPSELDAILLVGGSTRTPLVSRMLEERTGIAPRREVHPDLCVALGAGVLAARLAGRDVERVLVDVSPFSFGPSHLDELGGQLYPHCYQPVIARNTPLPVTRTERYFTAMPRQTKVQVDVYQGEDPDALKNALVGCFLIEGLTPTDGQNEVLCRMSLDVDGILQVSAIEKRTGLSKQIRIEGALTKRSEQDTRASRERLGDLYARRGEDLDAMWEEPEEDDPGELEDDEGATNVVVGEAGDQASADSNGESLARARREGDGVVTRCRGLLANMHGDDREEAIALIELIHESGELGDTTALSAHVSELKEILFFVEGRP